MALLSPRATPGIGEPSGLPEPSFSDDFNDNSLDTGLWLDQGGGGATLAEVNQRIEVTLPSGATNPVRYLTGLTPVVLTARRVWVELTANPAVTNQYAKLWLYKGGLQMWVGTEGNRLRAYLDTVGVFADVAYDATAHRWLSLHEAGGALTFEASVDGVAWTTLGTQTAPADLTGLTYELESSYNGGVNPTTRLVYWDNANVVAGGPGTFGSGNYGAGDYGSGDYGH